MKSLTRLHRANQGKCVGSLAMVDADDVDAGAARKSLVKALAKLDVAVKDPDGQALQPERPILFGDKELSTLTLVTPVVTLEAWLLADHDAVKNFLAPKDPSSVKLPSGSPEKLPNPKKVLEKIIKDHRGTKAGYRPEDAQGIARISNPDAIRRVAPSFLAFEEALVGMGA